MGFGSDSTVAVSEEVVSLSVSSEAVVPLYTISRASVVYADHRKHRGHVHEDSLRKFANIVLFQRPNFMLLFSPSPSSHPKLSRCTIQLAPEISSLSHRKSRAHQENRKEEDRKSTQDKVLENPTPAQNECSECSFVEYWIRL